MKSVFVECGTTARSSVNTGIQRVVRNIAARAPQTGLDHGLDCVLVQYSYGTFALLSREEFQPRPGYRAKARHRLGMVDRWLSNGLGNVWYPVLRPVLKNLFAWVLHERRKLVGPEPILRSGSAQDSALLLLDSTWDTTIWEAVDQFREEGGHVCAVLYDLIPFTHPATCAEGTRVAHTSWWSRAPEHVDSILCISRTVRNDFLEWQDQQPLSRKLSPAQVGYFYLGSELLESDPHTRLLTENGPFLMSVGSLEPRKNHAAMLDAFDLIWATGEEVRLAIVGSFGWKSEALMARINHHPELNKKLFLICDATDRDLSSLYSSTVAVILASYAEGFGLPIVEAFQRGTSVVCSDIPVFREVAGEHAQYFDPFDPSSLAQAVLGSLQSWRQSGKARLPPNAKRDWLSWQQSTEQLLLRLKDLAETATRPAAQTPLEKHVKSH